MIIREHPKRIVIPQAAHAELTAELARHLNYERAGLAEPPETWFQAAARHDDGWLYWDRRPEVNPKTHAWFDFMNMPAATHLSIWKRSVELSQGLHPAVTWWVSSHVTRLYDLHNWSDEGWYVQRQGREFRKRQLLLQDQLEPAVRNYKAYEKLGDLLSQCDWFSLVLCMGHSEADILPMFSRDDKTPKLISEGSKVRIRNGWFRSGKIECEVQAFEIPDETVSYLSECIPITLAWKIDVA